MLRSGLLLVALWAVIVAPALCASGVLAHECHCDVECVCDHESDCEADPCSEIVLRKGESGEDLRFVAEITSPAAIPLRDVMLRVDALPTFPDRAPPLGVPHSSDLPLLS